VLVDLRDQLEVKFTMLGPFRVIEAGTDTTKKQETVILLMAVLPGTLTKEAARDAICELCKALDEYVSFPFFLSFFSLLLTNA
jgi:hypothetical protein